MSDTDSHKPRVLFLNRSYWPDTEATGQLLTALCEGLADEFDIHVLAGQPNVTTSEVEFQQTAQRNGVTIHRVKHSTFPKSNMVLKSLNFISFVRACRRQIHQVPQPDIVVFETDPFLLPFVADRFRRKTGCQVIGYLQDIYPDLAIALKKIRNSWPIRQLRKRLFDVYRRCDRMVVLSTDMRQLLLDDGIEKNRVRIIANWADTQQVVPIETDNRFREKFGLGEKFVAMYSGNLGLTQRLEEFVEAAALLQDDPEIQFVFIGRGATRPDLEAQVESLGLSNVLFCDYQPLEELSHSLSAGNLHLIPLTTEISRCLMPSKLYGILAAGRPYLTNAPSSSELYRVTEEQEVGFTVEAGSSQRIADAIRTAKADPDRLAAMGRRARKLAEEEYTRELSIQRFGEMLHEIQSDSQA